MVRPEFLAGLLVRAAEGAETSGRTVRSLTAQFLTPAPLGAVVVTTRSLREGGSSAVLAGEVCAPDGQASVVGTVTLGRGRPAGDSVHRVPAPHVPAVADCAPLDLPPAFVPFGQHVSVRTADGQLPLAGGPAPVLTAWVRPTIAATLDAAALTFMADVMPPALYGATRSPVPVPTVELSVAFTGAAAQGEWLLCRIATRTAGDGWCVDDSEVWDEAGTLLLQARQSRRVLGSVIL